MTDKAALAQIAREYGCAADSEEAHIRLLLARGITNEKGELLDRAVLAVDRIPGLFWTRTNIIERGHSVADSRATSAQGGGFPCVPERSATEGGRDAWRAADLEQAADGVVDKVIDVGSTSYGRYVTINHGWGMTLYAHLSEMLVGKGQRVRRGERIGLSGSTGYSTGPHLHFGVRPLTANRSP